MTGPHGRDGLGWDGIGRTREDSVAKGVSSFCHPSKFDMSNSCMLQYFYCNVSTILLYLAWAVSYGKEIKLEKKSQ